MTGVNTAGEARASRCDQGCPPRNRLPDGQHTDAAKRIVTDEVQANDAIHALHRAFFDHRFGPTDTLFGWLKDEFHVARQFILASG